MVARGADAFPKGPRVTEAGSPSSHGLCILWVGTVSGQLLCVIFLELQWEEGGPWTGAGLTVALGLSSLFASPMTVERGAGVGIPSFV